MPTPEENIWSLSNKLLPLIVEHVKVALADRNAQWAEWAIPKYGDGYMCRGCSEVDDTREGIDHLDGCKVAALLKAKQ